MLVVYFSVFIAVGFYLFYLFGYLSSRVNFDLNSRGLIWSLLLDSISHKPFFGVGFGVSTEAIISAGNFSIAQFSAHNLYLMIFSEIGLIGGFAVLSLLFCPILYYSVMLYFFRNDHRMRCIFSALFCFSTGILISSFFESYLLRFSPVFYFYLIVTGLSLQRSFTSARNPQS